MPILADLQLIWKVHKNFAVRCFVTIRYLVAPWRRIIGYLPKFDAHLDIGCGHGLLIHLLASRFPQATFYGIEPDQRKLDYVKRLSPGTRTEFMSPAEFKAGGLRPVDCVTLCDVLYCVPLAGWGDLLSLAFDHLRPGGFLIIKDTVDAPRWKYCINLCQEFFAIKLLGYTHGEKPHLESVGTFRNKIGAHGFEIRAEGRLDRGYVWPHYIFVVQKPLTTSNQAAAA